MDIQLEVMSADDYYGGGADYYATTPWINRPATITEYGARGVPNLFLAAAYESDGIWNAAHYKNPTFDAAAKTYFSAAEIKSQRVATKKMAGILLNDTPVITSYFITYVAAGSSKVQNYQAEACRRCGWPTPPWHSAMSSTGCRLRLAGSPPRRLDDRTRYVLKRLGLALITLVLLSVIVFAAAQLLPGERRPLGARPRRHRPRRSPRTTTSTAPTARPSCSTATGSAASRAATSASRSSRPGSPVWDILEPALVNSLKLAVFAFVLVVPLGILGGVFAGLRVGQGDRPRRSRSSGSRSRSCRSS